MRMHPARQRGYILFVVFPGCPSLKLFRDMRKRRISASWNNRCLMARAEHGMMQAALYSSTTNSISANVAAHCVMSSYTPDTTILVAARSMGQNASADAEGRLR